MNEDFTRLEARAEHLASEHEALMRNLISLRVKHHLTQAQVAERMGVTQPTVAAFERYDANPTLATMRRYAMAVGARFEHYVVDDCIDHSGRDFEGIVGTEHASRWVKVAPLSMTWRTGAPVG